MSEEKEFEVKIKREDGFSFKVDFGMESLIMDEPVPLGKGSGPNASKVLVAAVANCLSASLLFCLEKSRVEIMDLSTKVRGIIARNPEGRWRVKEFFVELSPKISDEDMKKLERCIEIFDDYCIVSQSVRRGIPITVKVLK